MHKLIFHIVLILSFLSSMTTKDFEIDKNGYFVFCPCMGRFGNQVDQMLGSFNFAKALNRTIIIPPFIELKNKRLFLMPFKHIFNIRKLSKFHRVITMDNFMSKMSNNLWPPSNRSVFCYEKRTVIYKSTEDGGCNAKDEILANFFWNQYRIDFISSNFHSPLNFKVDDEINIKKWIEAYPASKFPVLAFPDATSRFPAHRSVRFLQKYFKWSKEITNRTNDFLNGLEHPVLGIHIRQKSDWNNVCRNIEQDHGNRQHLFASAQCLGDNHELYPGLTTMMCLPDFNEIVSRITNYISIKGVKTIFLATDEDLISEQLMNHIKDIKLVKNTPTNLYLDLSILSRTNYYIGNCVSTYSAIATYDRLVNGLPVDFWGYYPKAKIEL